MLATFKETILSAKDKTYGSVIVEKTFRQVLWYWTKYIILFAFIPLLLLVFLITYSVPLLPKILKDNVPNISFSVNNGELSVDPQGPLTFGNSDFRFILDLQGSPDILDTSPAGILVLSNQVIIKNAQGEVQSIDFKNVDDFVFKKTDLVDWITKNQTLLYFGLVVTAIILTLVTTALYWVSNLVIFLLWSVVFYYTAKLLKKSYTFKSILKLTVYASVPSVIISALLFVAPNQLLSLLNFGLFIFFFFSWLVNLPAPTTNSHTPEKKKVHRRKK